MRRQRLIKQPSQNIFMTMPVLDQQPGALCESGRIESAKQYGALLLANIGYSNDFRVQNPDRWWEALTYMIHSLWGGITAASAYKVFEKLKDTRYLEASYRATAGILYCYDTHSTATSPLAKGMAASTYAVAGPHINSTGSFKRPLWSVYFL